MLDDLPGGGPPAADEDRADEPHPPQG
jgi:hypothetical protein